MYIVLYWQLAKRSKHYTLLHAELQWMPRFCSPMAMSRISWLAEQAACLKVCRSVTLLKDTSLSFSVLCILPATVNTPKNNTHGNMIRHINLPIYVCTHTSWFKVGNFRWGVRLTQNNSPSVFNINIHMLARVCIAFACIMSEWKQKFSKHTPTIWIRFVTGTLAHLFIYVTGIPSQLNVVLWI